MTLHRLAILLIIVYGISILGFSILETGHAVLHVFKNSIHYHAHGHHHAAEDHKVLVTSDESSDADTDSIGIGCYFLFFDNLTHRTKVFLSQNQHFCEPGTRLASTVRVPFIPPPIQRLFHHS